MKKLLILIVILVAGYFALERFYPQILQKIPVVKQEVIKEAEQKLQDETANWRTYQNDQYGFEIKYPKTWIDTEHSYGLDVFQIKIENRKYNFFIQKNEKGGVDPLNDPGCFKEINKTTFNNINWSINEEGCGEGGSTAISAFLYKNNLVYRILSETIGDLSKSTEEFNQILSTFKFIK